MNSMFPKEMLMLALPEPGFSKGNCDVGPHQWKYQNNQKQSKTYYKTKEQSTQNIKYKNIKNNQNNQKTQ